MSHHRTAFIGLSYARSQSLPICEQPDTESAIQESSWTPRDQVEWNRLTQTGWNVKIISAGCGSSTYPRKYQPMEEEDGGEKLIDHDGDGFYRNGEEPRDCDDVMRIVHPDADELCNGIDDNCNGIIDEGSGLLEDNDGDGYYMDNSNSSYHNGSSHFCDGDDCDDTDISIHPRAEEIRGNNIDENCNGMFDADEDEDGYAIIEGDCNDLNPFINPSLDQDRDGYISIQKNGDDCDDCKPDVHPGVEEICGDRADNNCNDGIDENCP